MLFMVSDLTFKLLSTNTIIMLSAFTKQIHITVNVGLFLFITSFCCFFLVLVYTCWFSNIMSCVYNICYNINLLKEDVFCFLFSLSVTKLITKSVSITTNVVSSNPAQARTCTHTTLCDKVCQWPATD